MTEETKFRMTERLAQAIAICRDLPPAESDTPPARRRPALTEFLMALAEACNRTIWRPRITGKGEMEIVIRRDGHGREFGAAFAAILSEVPRRQSVVATDRPASPQDRWCRIKVEDVEALAGRLAEDEGRAQKAA